MCPSTVYVNLPSFLLACAGQREGDVRQELAGQTQHWKQALPRRGTFSKNSFATLLKLPENAAYSAIVTGPRETDEYRSGMLHASIALNAVYAQEARAHVLRSCSNPSV